MELSLIQNLTIAALPILFAITLHEVAHGYVALLCGDTTAKMFGRLSLNPVNHIDLVGTVIVPAITFALGGFMFGWAKPVPVNWQNFRNWKRDSILVALAGPAANFAMALFWAFITKLALMLGASQGGAPYALALMGQFGVKINLFLMLLNLIPIPPLDGSRVLMALLPPRLAASYARIEPYGFFIILGLLVTKILVVIIGIPYIFLSSFIAALFGLSV